MTRIEHLIAAAETDSQALQTITRADGSTYTSIKGYGSAVDGPVQAYAVPVMARTRPMRGHYRVTFYLLVDGKWKRTDRSSAERELNHDPNNCSVCGTMAKRLAALEEKQ